MDTIVLAVKGVSAERLLTVAGREGWEIIVPPFLADWQALAAIRALRVQAPTDRPA